jgi:hypothetical protein
LKYCTWQKSTHHPSTVNFILDHDFKHGVMSKKPPWSPQQTCSLQWAYRYLCGEEEEGRNLCYFSLVKSLCLSKICLKEVMYDHILTLSSITLHVFSLISCNHVLINVHFLCLAIQLSKKTIRLLMYTLSFKILIYDFGLLNTCRWDWQFAPEPVTNYQSMLCNIPEEWRPHILQISSFPCL